jgi:serine/threonine protein kinase
MERQFGPYRLVRQVAVGGMAEIHLARARGIAGFEKYVALKMIHPNFAADEQFIEMLVDEAKIAVQLTHHNIAQTFDLGHVGETYYISMEYVDGSDLYKVLRRASEQDIEFPLDVCAFIAKEVASGLDYAHRKRDVSGNQLGIVHRDVSPQNVLLSYAGEVKLVDFGIAKATMKVKQTAAGVIKGKYYYMSPEQASGGNVDARSDIFSAGIVLYEMLTGQMLYLEEDLHRLLDMVRRADIAPPSKLRRGIPPQLERIVMHALAKTPQQRYQSGSDMASDLERFLHAHSPVFTPAKIVSLLRNVIGDSTLAHERDQADDAIEVLDDSNLLRDPSEMRDSNSVIFRVKPRPLHDFPPIDTNATTDSGLEGRLDGLQPAPPSVAGAPAPRAEPRKPPQRAPTRPPPVPGGPAKPRAATAPIVHGDSRPVQAAAPLPRVAPRPQAAAPALGAGKRGMFDETRELPNDFEEEGAPQTGVMDPPTSQDLAKRPMTTMPMYGVEDLEGGDSTMVSQIPNFHSETSEIEHTMVNASVPVPEHTDYGDTLVRAKPNTSDSEDEDGPTLPGRPGNSTVRPLPIGAPAALAARNPTPSVSELRRPRPSRSTPSSGVPNVLQALMAAPGNEPMPAAPRASAPAAAPFEATMTAPHTYLPSASPEQPTSPTHEPPPPPPSQYAGAGALPYGGPGAPHPRDRVDVSLPATYDYPSAQYAAQYSPPLGATSAPLPGYPSPQQPYGSGGYPMMMHNGAMAFPQGGAAATATGRLRALELDEIPPHYRIKRDGPRWFVLLGLAVVAVSAAASVTFMLLRANRDRVAASSSLRLESIPAGAAVIVDGTRLEQPTPTVYRQVKAGGRYQVRLELPRHKPYVTEVSLRSDGGETTLNASLTLITGELLIESEPAGADVYVNNASAPRGQTPLVMRELDMENTKSIELRHARCDPHRQELRWPESGTIQLNIAMTPSGCGR